MKYSEFKRKANKLGFKVNEKNAEIEIIYKNGVVAWVSKDFEAVMKSFYSYPLSTELGAKLFDILVEFARTPIEDRKDEKRYSIYPIRTMAYKLVRFEAIFRECGYEDEDSFDIYSPPYFIKGTSVAFTESEAKEICDFFGWDFDKVAVEVEDDE